MSTAEQEAAVASLRTHHPPKCHYRLDGVVATPGIESPLGALGGLASPSIRDQREQRWNSLVHTTTLEKRRVSQE